MEDDIAVRFKKYQNSSRYNYNSEEVFCICRQPDHGGELMVLCTGCDDWFHFRCMGLDEEWEKLISTFFCIFCEWQQKGTTLWKRRCRLAECREPSRSDSKYCSDQHGLEYMQTVLLHTSRHTISPADTRQMLDAYTTPDALRGAGSHFPELAIVSKYRSDKKPDMFPRHVQEQLTTIETKMRGVQDDKSVLIQQQEHLAAVNGKLKHINDTLVATLDTTKAKKAKKKRIEFCLYSADLKYDELDDALIGACTAKYEDAAAPDWHQGICVKERKKCVRHNGWWNLAYDRLTKMLLQLDAESAHLEGKREAILRDYSVGEYEKKEKTEEMEQKIEQTEQTKQKEIEQTEQTKQTEQKEDTEMPEQTEQTEQKEENDVADKKDEDKEMSE